MIYIINIAENPKTKRGQRHVKLFQTILEEKESEVVFMSSNFDHGLKQNISTRDTSTEVYFSLPGYKSNLSIMRQINHMIFSLKTFVYLVTHCSKGDIIITSSIPAECPFIVALVRKIRSVRLIVDIRDIWPNAFPKPGMKNIIFSKYARVLNRFSFPRADEIIVANRDFEPFTESYGCVSQYVPLGYDSGRFNIACGVKDHLRTGCVYLGNLNRSFNLTTLAGFCRNREVSIFGEGDLENDYIQAFGTDNLKGFVDYKEVPNTLRKFEFGLLPITGTATLPNKLFDYLASGLSIVTNDFVFAKNISLDSEEIVEVDGAYVVTHNNCRTDFMIDYTEVSQNILRIARGE